MSEAGLIEAMIYEAEHYEAQGIKVSARLMRKAAAALTASLAREGEIIERCAKVADAAARRSHGFDMVVISPDIEDVAKAIRALASPAPSSGGAD